MSGFENQWGVTSGTQKTRTYLQDCQRPIGSQDSDSERPTHKLTLRPGPEAAVWEAPWLYVREISRLTLGCVPEGQGSVGTFSSNRVQASAILLACLLLAWPTSGGCQF